ncbi:actinia tenebrosa protease inhibitors-like [Dendropsophus ebraccatus]|uniref:actinia tenebrosa protease inhibitors-like n=1 Tax=Dendropsophus ebraccatus TaxID=150705 RepID=UPI003831F78C
MKTSAVLLVLAACFLLIPQVSAADRCKLSPQQGPCEASMRRFYYDAAEKKCKQFTYGGCGGNANNFKKLRDCRKACKRVADKVLMSAWTAETSMTDRRPGSSVLRHHATFRNYFLSQALSLIKDTSAVNAPTLVVNSDKDFPQFLTSDNIVSNTLGSRICISPSSDTSSAPSFSGSSCHFPAIYIYSRYCHIREELSTSNRQPEPSSSSPPAMKTSAVLPVLAACFLLLSQAAPGDICLLPFKSGRCLDYIPRYFYDANNRKCRQFVYSGCRGNANNFETLLECERVCKGS